MNKERYDGCIEHEIAIEGNKFLYKEPVVDYVNELKNENKELKLTIAKILDNRYEDDKLYLIIDNQFGMNHKEYLKKYKEELGY